MPRRRRPATIPLEGLGSEKLPGEFLDQAIASAREELKTKGFLEKVPPDSELDDDEEGDDELDDLDEFDDDFIEDELAIEEVDLAAESPESLTGDDEDFDDDAWDRRHDRALHGRGTGPCGASPGDHCRPPGT